MRIAARRAGDLIHLSRDAGVEAVDSAPCREPRSGFKNGGVGAERRRHAAAPARRRARRGTLVAPGPGGDGDAAEDEARR